MKQTAVSGINRMSGYSLEQWGGWFACTQKMVPNVAQKCLNHLVCMESKGLSWLPSALLAALQAVCVRSGEAAGCTASVRAAALLSEQLWLLVACWPRGCAGTSTRGGRDVKSQSVKNGCLNCSEKFAVMLWVKVLCTPGSLYHC